jgi:hypothetical protein
MTASDETRFCPWCQRDGERSRVSSGSVRGTLMNGVSPYWDEDGKLHTHDPNIYTATFGCSRGHRWSEVYAHGCPAGDLVDEQYRILNAPFFGYLWSWARKHGDMAEWPTND